MSWLPPEALLGKQMVILECVGSEFQEGVYVPRTIHIDLHLSHTLDFYLALID